jgi:RNA polymerase sigma-70 factor (ECF subfamily)
MTPWRGARPEDAVYGEQLGRRLRAALDRLSARQRAVFTLRHYEDMSLEEIATTLGLDVGTVKAHMSRALAKMREELKDLYQGTCQ